LVFYEILFFQGAWLKTDATGGGGLGKTFFQRKAFFPDGGGGELLTKTLFQKKGGGGEQSPLSLLWNTQRLTTSGDVNHGKAAQAGKGKKNAVRQGGAASASLISSPRARHFRKSEGRGWWGNIRSGNLTQKKRKDFWGGIKAFPADAAQILRPLKGHLCLWMHRGVTALSDVYERRKENHPFKEENRPVSYRTQGLPSQKRRVRKAERKRGGNLFYMSEGGKARRKGAPEPPVGGPFSRKNARRESPGCPENVRTPFRRRSTRKKRTDVPCIHDMGRSG